MVFDSVLKELGIAHSGGISGGKGASYLIKMERNTKYHMIIAENRLPIVKKRR
jgi:hypothetical protein